MAHQVATALITGASRGIGKATAELFGSRGYNVLLNYNRSEAAALDLLENLQKKGISAAVFRADVAKKTEVQAMTEFCAGKFGGIDILINNAAIAAALEACEG